MVLDGEIVIAGPNGLDFDSLQMRIHPAASRVKMLVGADAVVLRRLRPAGAGRRGPARRALRERRKRLVETLKDVEAPVYLTPCTDEPDEAQDWFERFEGAGLDGVIAKLREDAYQPGKRGWLKIKHLRTVDCVVGGFRWNRGEEGKSVGSLLLGFFDDERRACTTSATRRASRQRRSASWSPSSQPYVADDEGDGFGQGRTPGAPSRWTGDRDMTWVRLRPELVCEVTFDYLQGANGPGARFRHAATFQRWRTDKPPEQCGFDQIETTPPYELQQIFGQ